MVIFAPWTVQSCYQSLTLRRLELRRRQKPRRLPHLRRLLEGVGELDQRGLAPGLANERDRQRQAEGEAGGDGDARVAGHRGGGGGAPRIRIAVDEVDQPGGAAGGGHEGVQLVLGE